MTVVKRTSKFLCRNRQASPVAPREAEPDGLPLPSVARPPVQEWEPGLESPSGNAFAPPADGRSGMKRGWLLLAAVLVLLAPLLWWVQTRTTPPPVAPVPANMLPVFALGQIEPWTEVIRVNAPSGAGDARVETLSVREGDEVRAGDLLATLDEFNRLSAGVDVAKSRVALREAELLQTELIVRTTRNQREAAVASAQAGLDQAKSNYERRERLVASGAVTEDQFDRARMEFRTAEQSLLEAQAALQRYEAEDLPDLQVARQELASAKADLGQAEANLDRARILAPMNGRILDVLARPGERVGAAPLLTMGDVSVMNVRAEVYESDVHRVHVGQQVRITASPLAQPLTGVVTRLGSQVVKQGIVSSEPAAFTDARVVEVWAELDQESAAVAANLVNLQVKAEFLP